MKIAEPILSVTARALEINGINLVEHCKDALGPKQAVEKFMDFVENQIPSELQSGNRVALVGHNVGFDIGFMRRLWRLAEADFDLCFSDRTLDTAGSCGA